MKHIIASIILIALLLLSGCTEPTEEPEKSDTAPAPAVTTSDVTTHTSDPSVTTAPVTTDAKTPVTSAPTTDDVPDTNLPVTDDTPVTDTPPTIDDPPAVPETVEIPAELSAIAQRHPLASGLTGSYAGKTVTELLDSSTEAFENAVRRSVQAKGQIVLDKGGIVTLMLGASRYDLALSYLSGTMGTELYSKISTDKGKSTEDRQVYIGGWLYNTGTTTENGKQTATDNFKVKMTPNQFSDYALSGADRSFSDLSLLTKMISTASSSVAGMDEQGNCVILAKGIDEQLIRPILDPDDAIGNALSSESFDAMEVAILIGADGNVSELYVSLPMRIVITQSGITLSVNGRAELTLSIDLPATITVSAPTSAAEYKELTIEEAYANRSSLFNW